MAELGKLEHDKRLTAPRKQYGGAAGITPLKKRGGDGGRAREKRTPVTSSIPEDEEVDNDDDVYQGTDMALPEWGDDQNEVSNARVSRNSFYAFADFNESIDCQICLESLEPEDGTEGDEIVQLMCRHRFHKKCIEEFRNFGVNSVCNICRKKLPTTADRMFDDGASLYWPIHNRVDQGLALWSALGRRESKDMAEVGRLWLAAAEAGHTHAQHNVGCLFAQGNGVQQSDSTALKWFEKAVEQGEMHAMYDLARMYILGRGVEQSDEKAARWYREAAQRGHVNAQFNLGAMHLSGRGVEKNDEESMKWFKAAGDQGDEESAAQAEKLRDYLEHVTSNDTKKTKK